MQISLSAREDAEFRVSMSPPRLGPYLRAASDVNHALSLYAWNLHLSAALKFSLHVFEVCLRNRLSPLLDIEVRAELAA